MNAVRQSRYDLVVIGGGPAGCAAAIAAKRKHPSASVLLLEKGEYPRHKVCGEFVSPEAVGLLKFLSGDHGGISVQNALSIHRARLLIGGHKLEVQLSPAAMSLTRYKLDALLWSAARVAGVECVHRAQVQAVRDQNPFHITVGGHQLQARAVVNASGRWSNVSPRFANGAPCRWIGLKAHFAESSTEPIVDLYFLNGGYCGVQPVGAGTVNACAMVRADIATDLEDVFARHGALHRRSRRWEPLTAVVATAPLLFQPPCALWQGQMLAGDAAGFIDPFLGDGISLALHSGSMAGETAAQFCAGCIDFAPALARYETGYRQNLTPAFSRAAALRRLLSLPEMLRWPIMKVATLPRIAEFIFSKTRSLTPSASQV